MTFANDSDSDCIECKRILNRDGVADGYKTKCHQCPYDIKIINCKRVKYADLSKYEIKKAKESGNTVAKQDNKMGNDSDRELE